MKYVMMKKWNTWKKYCLITKKLNLLYFFLYKYMADYYRKTVNNTDNDVKLKMQMAAFTLKLSENINKINDLLEVDKNIKKDIVNNSNSIKNVNKDVTNNLNRIYIN